MKKRTLSKADRETIHKAISNSLAGIQSGLNQMIFDFYKNMEVNEYGQVSLKKPEENTISEQDIINP